MLRPTHISARRLLHHAQSRDGPAPFAWSPWACTAGPCPKETPQQIPGPGSTPPAVIPLAHGQLAPPQANHIFPGEEPAGAGALRLLSRTTSTSRPGPRQAPRPGPSPSPSNRAHCKPLDPGLRQALQTGPSASTSINPFASRKSLEQLSNQAGPGTPRPSFAALRQGMRMGSDSPERHDFGPAYHSSEGREIKGRS